MGWVLLAILAIIFTAIKELLPIVGVLVLLVVGYFVIKLLGKGIKHAGTVSANTIELAKQGWQRKKEMRKNATLLKSETTQVDQQIERLSLLREQHIDGKEIERLFSFTSLLSDCSRSSAAEECLVAIRGKKKVLSEIEEIEEDILQLAEKYKSVGNAEKCSYYLGFITKGTKQNQLAVIERQCERQALDYELEKDAIKKVVTAAIIILCVIVLIWFISFAANTPYRNFEAEIRNKTLTADMVDYSWRSDEEDGIYHEYFKEPKGKRIVNNALNRYKQENDVESALWLLQTISYSKYDEEISNRSINQWIIDACMEKGKVTSEKDGSSDRYYNIKIEYLGYRITTYHSGSGIDYSDLYISKAN